MMTNISPMVRFSPALESEYTSHILCSLVYHTGRNFGDKAAILYYMKADVVAIEINHIFCIETGNFFEKINFFKKNFDISMHRRISLLSLCNVCFHKIQNL